MKFRTSTETLILSRCIRLLAALFLSMGLLHQAYAQSITGTLIGTVSDGQGALVPAAAVKATNVDTGVAHTAVTNEQGEYRIEFLGVGSYVVEVKAKNFKTFVQRNVSLLADQTRSGESA